MTTLRSRRLETVLGATVDQLAASNMEALVSARVSEEFDLDYKSSLYGAGDSEKRDLAGDVAALANSAGGVVIIGIEEDAHARAAAAPGVALSDTETRRMSQIIASALTPMPRVEIYAIPSTHNASHGFYVVAVPRSPLAPHAVTVNDALRYPVRNGTTTRYLTEPEVAAAYRQRALGGRDQLQRLTAAFQVGITALNPEVPWVLVVATAEVAGDIPMTSASFDTTRARTQGRPSLFSNNASFMQFGVGRHRWSAHGGTQWGDGSARYLAMDLHADGTVFFARQLWDIRDDRSPAAEDGVDVVNDESIVSTLVEGLARFGQHAQQEAQASGQAAMTAALVSARDRQITIGQARNYGFGHSRGTVTDSGQIVSSVVYGDVDDLACEGRGLMQTARLLAAELGQSFGIVDMGQINEDGDVVANYWAGGARSAMVAWARSRPALHVVST